MKKLVCILLGCLLVFPSIMMAVACSSDEGKGHKTELVIDGGGQNATFNSTSSMIYDPYANPYPYNTLEVLAEEWNEAHKESEFYFSVAKTSINNDRETMVPALNQGTAPDILYYLASGSEDLSKNWFVDLSSYLEEPNKYSKEGEAGSIQWKDIYSPEEFNAMFSSNGKKYTVEIELNPIGILYNKKLFNLAGIEETPKTFKEFMEIQDAIHEYSQTIGRADPMSADYITPYSYLYFWYNGAIESAIYADKLPYYDVINPDGIVDAEEFVRAYMTKDDEGNRLYSPNDEKAKEVARLIRLKSKYFPTNFESYYAEQQFVQGNLAMVEATGGGMRKIIDARGFSGYSTGWGVSCTAMNKGDEAVAACVDFLQFVTCFENNDRLINDKGFSIPLSGNCEYEPFMELGEMYAEDKQNEKSIAWAAVSSGGNMNKEFYDKSYLTHIAFVTASDSEIDELLDSLVENFQNAANNLYTQNQWDINKWPAYGDTLR